MQVTQTSPSKTIWNEWTVSKFNQKTYILISSNILLFTSKTANRRTALSSMTTQNGYNKYGFPPPTTKKHKLSESEFIIFIQKKRKLLQLKIHNIVSVWKCYLWIVKNCSTATAQPSLREISNSISPFSSTYRNWEYILFCQARTDDNNEGTTERCARLGGEIVVRSCRDPFHEGMNMNVVKISSTTFISVSFSLRSFCVWV